MQRVDVRNRHLTDLRIHICGQRVSPLLAMLCVPPAILLGLDECVRNSLERHAREPPCLSLGCRLVGHLLTLCEWVYASPYLHPVDGGNVTCLRQGQIIASSLPKQFHSLGAA